jgi:hypothetical protein
MATEREAAAASEREAMQAALEALEQVTTSETFYRDPRGDRAGPAIDALRAALSRAPQAVRAPLTEEQIRAVSASISNDRWTEVAFARAIEAKHGIVPLAPQEEGGM